MFHRAHAPDEGEYEAMKGPPSDSDFWDLAGLALFMLSVGAGIALIAWATS